MHRCEYFSMKGAITLFAHVTPEELCDRSSFWDILIKAHKLDHC